MKYIKSMYPAYINDRSVEMYETENGVLLRIERREHKNPKGAEMGFKDVNAAQRWYDNLGSEDDDGLVRLHAAIGMLADVANGLDES